MKPSSPLDQLLITLQFRILGNTIVCVVEFLFPSSKFSLFSWVEEAAIRSLELAFSWVVVSTDNCP